MLMFAFVSLGTLRLEENEKRWMVVGVAIHKVLASTLRGFMDPALKSYFNQHCSTMRLQTANNYHKKDPKKLTSSFNYSSVNGNEAAGRKNWNFSIKDHNVFAKLYLTPFMAKFSNVGDQSCDISALLTILSGSGAFTFSQQDAAKNVKDSVRNHWGHCRWDAWDDNMYAKCFQLMKDLVKSLGLGSGEKTAAINDLESWEDKGQYNMYSFFI